MFDEHILSGGGAALHAVQNHHVGPGLHRQGSVEIGPGAANLHIDRHPPASDFAQFEDLDLQIIRPGPIRVTAGGPLVDPLGQGPHLGHPVADLLAKQHAAAAGFGALAHDDLDRIGLAQVVGVHPVARGQVLIDELGGMAPFLGRHAAIPGGGGGARRTCPAPERLFRLRRQRAEAHARDGDGNVQMNGVLGKARAKRHRGVAAFAVAFQRVARHRRAKKQQVVEMRYFPLRAATSDVVDAGRRRAADLGIDRVGKRRRLEGDGAGDLVVLIAHGPRPQ